ncbi:hypothetical protein Ntsu_67300 [Nocardia sp. IFM 10818]
MHWDQMTATPDHLRVSIARLRGGAMQQDILEALLAATDGPWVGMLDADARYTAELKLHLVGRYRLTAAVTSAGKLSLAQLTDLTSGRPKDKVLSTKTALRQGFDDEKMPKPPAWLAYIQEWIRNASAVVDRRAVIEYHLRGADRRLAAMDDTIAGMRASLDERIHLRDQLAAEIADLRAELEPTGMGDVPPAIVDAAGAPPFAADAADAMSGTAGTADAMPDTACAPDAMPGLADAADTMSDVPALVDAMPAVAHSADAMPVVTTAVDAEFEVDEAGSGRDAFQDSARENVVEGEGFEVDVADVAVAHGEGAGARGEGVAVGAVVEVAQDVADEMAAADDAVAVDGDDRGAGAASPAGGGVGVTAEGEERIESSPDGGLGIGVGVTFGGVHP